MEGPNKAKGGGTMKYVCPECTCALNPNKGIVLVGHHKKSRGLFVFDPAPGNYNYEVDSFLTVEPGQVWEFQCPICHVNLTTHFSAKLAHMKMIEDGIEHLIVFSKVANEHATFVLTKEKVEIFGVDHDNYLELSIQKYYW